MAEPLLPREYLADLNASGFTVARLLHVGWQDKDSHELLELETDEDYVPPNCHPVFALGSALGATPSLNELEDPADEVEDPADELED